ncbi:MAG TPA: enoyl-CoA hydratase-related protein, partial [Candidatus Binatia bacterium]|nr:enoyl-CoA hydratase-related protein [Candidatus Binatia bacterium]
MSLVVESASGVATLTLDRPEVHNAFDETLIARLTDAFTAAADDGGIRAIVLRANGKSFSAGADLNWMKRMAGFSEAENLADAFTAAAGDAGVRAVVLRANGKSFSAGAD